MRSARQLLNTLARIAILILRRSTDRQDKSIEEQREFLMNWAARNGFTVIREYVDDAVSGDDHVHRRGLERVMLELESENREWNYILTYDKSRHTRADLFEAAGYADRILKAGADLVYCA